MKINWQWPWISRKTHEARLNQLSDLHATNIEKVKAQTQQEKEELADLIRRWLTIVVKQRPHEPRIYQVVVHFSIEQFYLTRFLAEEVGTRVANEVIAAIHKKLSTASRSKKG